MDTQYNNSMNPEHAKAYAMALRYLARRWRSTFEMRQYLESKSILPEVVELTLTRLGQDNYLDDQRFCELYIENRIRFKPKSRFALGHELKAKGIDPDLIESQIEGLDDLELALSAIQNKAKTWRRHPLETQRKKLMNHLGYRGFNYGTCQAVWEIFSSES